MKVPIDYEVRSGGGISMDADAGPLAYLCTFDDAVVVFVTNFSLLFRLTLAISTAFHQVRPVLSIRVDMVGTNHDKVLTQ